MDGRFKPRTITSRSAGHRPPVERHGNLVALRFDLRPDPARIATTAWYHAEAIKDEAERRPQESRLVQREVQGLNDAGRARSLPLMERA